MADVLLTKTLVIILASVCAVGLLARIRLPAAVGYLVAGLVIGPHGSQLLAASDESRFLAELGIIFLMFMVGLEFSLPAMIAAGRDVLKRISDFGCRISGGLWTSQALGDHPGLPPSVRRWPTF